MLIPGVECFDSSVPMPLMKLPMRTIILDLIGARVMFSPGSKLTPLVLSQTGVLSDIVAPSLLHTAGMKAAASAHPQARLWGPRGCRDKHPDIKWHAVLGVDPWPYEDEVTMVPVLGMPRFNENVFLYKAGRALLVSDLVFNMNDSRGFGAWLMLSLFGTYRRLGVSKLYLKFVKDRPALQASLSQIAALDFDHLIPSHGHILMDTGRARFFEAVRERGFQI